MNTLNQVTLNMLRFFLSFKSVVAFLVISIALVLLFEFGTSKADGFGYSSTLYVLGGSLPIPFMVLSTTYNTVFMLASLAVVMISFQFSEFLLFGHISHSVVGRIQSRYTVITAFLIALLVISLPMSLIFIAHYFAIASSISSVLFLILIGWMYTFTLVLMTILILNINSLRKVALFVMILAFLVAPATFMIISNGLKSLGGFYSFLSHGTFEIYSFLGLHFHLSRLIDFTISSSFINWSEFSGLLIYIIPYLTIIILTFQKKELT